MMATQWRDIEKNSLKRKIAIETATKRKRTYTNNAIRWKLRHADLSPSIDEATNTWRCILVFYGHTRIVFCISLRSHRVPIMSYGQ